ncbi:hypothetical protein C8R43DRAFT_1132737 [Mycena crocata]|nr:hypothetical protein C8R43DRAFT_1132737 [Mycena crocata]
MHQLFSPFRWLIPLLASTVSAKIVDHIMDDTDPDIHYSAWEIDHCGGENRLCKDAFEFEPSLLSNQTATLLSLGPEGNDTQISFDFSGTGVYLYLVNCKEAGIHYVDFHLDGVQVGRVIKPQLRPSQGDCRRSRRRKSTATPDIEATPQHTTRLNNAPVTALPALASKPATAVPDQDAVARVENELKALREQVQQLRRKQYRCRLRYGLT